MAKSMLEPYLINARMIRAGFESASNPSPSLDEMPDSSASFAGLFDYTREFFDLITDRLGPTDHRVEKMRNIVGRMHGLCRAVATEREIPELHQTLRYAPTTQPVLLDQDVKLAGREMHDRFREVIAALEKNSISEDNHKLLNSVCALSLDTSWVFCHVVGGIEASVAITQPKEYFSQNQRLAF